MAVVVTKAATPGGDQVFPHANTFTPEGTKATVTTTALDGTLTFFIKLTGLPSQCPAQIQERTRPELGTSM